MPRYETKLIADFKTGYHTAREPWLAPKDAFPVLLDARVDRGYLQKRLGYIELADTGAGLPIMGLHSYMRYGHPNYLVVDSARVYKYLPYDESLTDLSEADTFNGGPFDFFWFQNWRDKCYFCNGVDLPYVYDAPADTLASLVTIDDAETDIQINSCQMIFRYKGRLLFFGCTIAGKWMPRRLYYSEVNTEHVRSTNYVDGDMEDVFVSGCYVNGIPTLFGHEGFVAGVTYTGNSDTPFALAELEHGSGTLGPLQAPQYQRTILKVGQEGLFTWDGYQSRRIGPQIRDFVSDISNFNAALMQATMRRDRAIAYLAYPNDGSDENDRILEFNIDDGNFAIHRISAHCLLGTTGHIVPEIDFITDYVGDPDDGDIDRRDSHVFRHPTYKAMTLMGGHTGVLSLLNNGTDDDGTDITPEVWTVAINPYAPAGRKVKFGGCRILVGTSSTDSCTVSFYKDLSSTAYKTATLAADGSGDKHWVELFPDGEMGNFFRLSFTGAGMPDIHAIEVDLAPAGKLDGGSAASIVTLDATWAASTVWRMIQNEDTELETQKLIAGVWTTVEVTDA